MSPNLTTYSPGAQTEGFIILTKTATNAADVFLNKGILSNASLLFRLKKEKVSLKGANRKTDDSFKEFIKGKKKRGGGGKRTDGEKEQCRFGGREEVPKKLHFHPLLSLFSICIGSGSKLGSRRKKLEKKVKEEEKKRKNLKMCRESLLFHKFR